MFDFIRDLLHVFPSSFYYARKQFEVRPLMSTQPLLLSVFHPTVTPLTLTPLLPLRARADRPHRFSVE